ncbi:MAG: AAA-like domain-containing protein [Microcoleaceae cyanobacterium MO_207.B10]|nr:AAA-like domain-containing protein [Microcoleaceae cyanobacterium MO_207.B10]
MPKLFVFVPQINTENNLFASFFEELKTSDYEYFLANTRQNQNEVELIPEFDNNLKQSDYLILFLTAESVISEMVREIIRRATEFQDIHPDKKPGIIPIMMNIPINLSLDYYIYAYLSKMQQWQWQSTDNPQNLIAEIFALLRKEIAPPILKTKSQLINTNFPNGNDYNKLPLPSSAPNLPKNQDENQDNLVSSFYIKRPPVEELCYQEISKPGALIRIKAPRQMGKTSLMARILDHGSKLGYQTATLSFQLVDSQTFKNLDIFLRWFCTSIASELNLSANLDDYWNQIFGSKVSCKSYFERYILKSLDTPIVLGLDEVDRIFQYPEITSDFFSLLRAWHEDAKNRDIWKNMRLVVVHSTEAYVPIDINQSPFNVGLPIDLPEFTPQQIQDLAKDYQLKLDISEIEKLMSIIGGNPYLVKLGLYQILINNLTIDELLKTATTNTGIYADHLQRHWWNLRQQPELLKSAKKVMNSNKPVQLESTQGLKLRSMGLVNLQGNQATPSCNLYRLYFRNRL